MDANHSILYLTDAEISALALEVGSVREAISASYQLYAEGKLRCEAKTSIAVGPGHAFQCLSAVDLFRGYASVKWIGMVPPGGKAQVNINASILLSDVTSGQTRSLMDARQLTGLRTAGMSAEAARCLARRDSSSIGFVGAGVQAESHLRAFADVLPELRTVYINSRTHSSAHRFAEFARQLGFEVIITTPQRAVQESDVVVTSVPIAAGFEPFLDAAWLRPGAFVAAIDLGRSWNHEGLHGIDVTAVDEAALRQYSKPGNLVPSLTHAHATLADLASGKHPGRTDPDQRIMFFSSGSAVADLAIAILAFETALSRKVGTGLPI